VLRRIAIPLKSTLEEAARQMLEQRIKESKDGRIANIE
jgi:hypothetical protein